MLKQKQNNFFFFLLFLNIYLFYVGPYIDFFYCLFLFIIIC